jgi:hypothetical protein
LKKLEPKLRKFSGEPRKKRGRPPIPFEDRIRRHYLGMYIDQALWDRFDAMCLGKGRPYTHEGEEAIKRHVERYERSKS